MSDLPTVSVEMQRVLGLAREAGDATVEGKALTALAEVALLREADLPKATELVDAALDALPEDGRSAALAVRGQIAWWVGDFETGQRVAEEALELAQRRGRKDLEAQALNDLWKTYRHQNRLDEAEELLARELEVAEESGSIVARAHALNSAGVFHLDRHEPALALPLLEESRGLFAEVGDSWMLGRTLNALAWEAQQREDTAQEERYLREAIRLLKPLEDRGALCESQRQLAEVLIRRGRLEEAERVAVEATMTVGEHDVSSRATTTMTLGLVRAAQGRDDEAEELLLEALDLIEASGFHGLESMITTRLVEFLASRGRDDDAARYRERLVDIAPAAGLAAAFASRIDRIV
jgi:tetratricopeptide (TPR) repeat protein